MNFYALCFSATAPAHVPLATFLSMLAFVVVFSGAWYGLVAIATSQPKIASIYQGMKTAIDSLRVGLILSMGICHLGSNSIARA